MNILLVSQCDKRALTETRRLLDQFAERRGERTWQTPITQAGLDTLRKLLRRTARKNTAVACHWIRARDHSELLWIVGDAKRFNGEGAVPTNRTQRNVLRGQDENNWHTAQDIRLLAQMAALLHDLGKASDAFQARLRGKLQGRNLYRHEWVSLRLWQAFVGDDDDATWLQRLAAPQPNDHERWFAPGHYQRDGLDAATTPPFTRLPPLAAAIGWLILTHHRMPVLPVTDPHTRQQAPLGRRSQEFSPIRLGSLLQEIGHDWNEQHQPATQEQKTAYWEIGAQPPVIQAGWCAQAARVAKGLITLNQNRDRNWLDNPYVMHLARLSLMLADHHYSGLAADSPQRVQGDQLGTLYANTDQDKNLKQRLDEHLLGVARDAGLIAHALPGWEHHLPRLARHQGLRRRSADARFSWQDKAADTATALRPTAEKRGAFIINMASTGCGKTLANARILYALSDPQLGLRATFALGLRTLTLQTGQSYRKDLHLGADELAIRVGGSGSRALFAYYQQHAEASGSASTQDLIEEDSHVLFEGSHASHPLLERAMHDPQIRNLLSAPMLVCTVDHLAPATESQRAGRQIAPMLRLMSSDLVLDELDDFDLADLPALTRLVHWAGLLGSRVLLSSATLPPALVEGMFQAYHSGRLHYQRNRGEPTAPGADEPDIVCMWSDEFGSRSVQCDDATSYRGAHTDFVARRVAALAKAPARRCAELLPLPKQFSSQNSARIREEFATLLRDACVVAHHRHAQCCPTSGKRVSFGLARMANIEPLFDVAQALFRLGAPADHRIHLCVYHSRFPLAQRSAIEYQLDTALNRRRPDAVYAHPEIRRAIDAHPEANHLFIVLGSPVTEVGRDHDYDWAVVEPSSMRSLIQLAGRVQRHRNQPCTQANVLVFDTNLRHYAPRRADGHPPAAFVWPGFEQPHVDADHRFRLTRHRLDKLLGENEYRTITAIPRIQPAAAEALKPKQRLVDLEHARLMDCMLPSPATPPQLNAASAWQHPQAGLTGVLPQQQRFRDDPTRQHTLVWLPDEDAEALLLHRIDENPTQRGQDLYVPVGNSQQHRLELESQLGPGIGPWGHHDLMTLLASHAEAMELSLEDCAKRLTTVNVPQSTQGWRYHPWLGFGKQG